MNNQSTETNISLTRFADSIGANRVVLALSVARLGDAVGNSILFILIPLYVADIPAPWFPLPKTILVGLLISLYGLVNAILQPVMGAWADRRTYPWLFTPERVQEAASNKVGS